MFKRVIGGIRPEEEEQLATFRGYVSQLQEFADTIIQAYEPKNKPESQPLPK